MPLQAGVGPLLLAAGAFQIPGRPLLLATWRAGTGHDSMTTFWRHWGAVLERVIEGFICADLLSGILPLRSMGFRIASSAIF